jgi:hypothetical protein
MGGGFVSGINSFGCIWANRFSANFQLIIKNLIFTQYREIFFGIKNENYCHFSGVI